MIDCIKKQQERQQIVDDAERNYVDLIDKVEPFGTKDKVGKLYDCIVTTQVQHQAYAGASKFHINSAFDVALGKVIRKRFTELSEEALLLMQAEADAAHLELRGEIEEALAEIDELEATYAHTVEEESNDDLTETDNQ